MRNMIFIFLTYLVSTAAQGNGGPDTIIVSHDNHLAAGVQCVACHTTPTEPAPANLRPKKEGCKACHQVEEKDYCSVCHTNVEMAGNYPHREPPTIFSHTPHLSKQIDCTSCHKRMVASVPSFPEKIDCRGCHETANDYADCRLCHGPDDALVPTSHVSDWTSFHGAQARIDEGQCYLCHTRTNCQDCHVGDNVRPRSHNLNFIFEHASKARGREMDCYTCHQEPQFCGSCHMAERVLPRDHFGAGWIRQPDGGRHATAGLFDMENCIACHSSGGGSPTCAACHGG